MTGIGVIAGEAVQYVREFTETTTLHGIRYLSMRKLHLVETLLWLLVLTSSVYGAIKLIGNSWQRYNSNPTVLAIQKNFREWNITFPAATFCFLDNLDEDAAKEFIKKTWGILPPTEEDQYADESENDENITTTTTTQSTIGVVNEEKFNYYLTFLKDLTNVTYENLDNFSHYLEDESLNAIPIENTIMKVLRTINQKSTFFDKDFKDTEFLQSPTEMGMCYTHGGIISDYISLSGKLNVRKHFELPTCNFLNTLCYARTEGIPSDVRYYVHSPYEIPDISSTWFLVRGRMDRDTSFTVLETTVSPEIYRLTPSQRQCRFMTESTESHLQVYSFNLCRMQCRKKIAWRLCGCVPYFYTKQDGIPICDVKGLACLSPYSELLITLRNKGEKIPCDCLPQCIDNKYFVDREVVRQWSFPIPYDIRFRWAIEKFSKIRLRRDVIYSFEDLLVSFGGTAAFFLGCSVLSFAEIAYFFSLRLFWFIISHFRK